MELYGVFIVPLIIAFVQLLKNTGINPKYAGIIAWSIGVIVAVAYGLLEAHWTLLQAIIIGSALGLSAAGLYSTQKNAKE